MINQLNEIKIELIEFVKSCKENIKIKNIKLFIKCDFVDNCITSHDN
jgi:hypothetical protein